jgi:hypothetical protein
MNDVGNVQLSPKVVRTQKLQSCEIALAEGIQKNNPVVIRWFTSEILHLQGSWATVVTVALLDKSKAGEYRWRTAANPLGLVRTIARRTALKSYPELIFGDDADKVMNPNGRAVSSLRLPANGRPSTCADSNGEVLGTGSWHDEFIDKAHFDAGHDYDGPPIWQQLDFSLLSKETDTLSYDWNEIGQRLGLSGEQTELMKARAAGVTRAAMGQHLTWSQEKVERVWKAVQRLFDTPEMKEKARLALCPD